MLNCYYKDEISEFLKKDSSQIIGEITLSIQFDSNRNQNSSWKYQIDLLKQHLQGLNGSIFFEFSIPRMGKRVDVIIIVESLVIIIEFKVGSSIFDRSSIDQVWDYALDLKNFHKPSHNAILAPMLVCTESKTSIIEISTKGHNDNLLVPIKLNSQDIRKGIDKCLDFFHKANKKLTSQEFSEGSYFPTPTIIEAAISLYKSHSVDQITRSDSGAKNLSITTNEIISLIQTAKAEKKKFICFVTGVPGAGKTLVGLKVATDQLSEKESNSSVYLSGNGPLVKVLQEALARDRVKSQKSLGLKVKKSDVKASVKTFIQNIHHYRDAYLFDLKAPYDHVAIFDEAQRAWNKEQTIKFMKQRKGKPDFDSSEPEFLISCLDRHKDWAVIVCLVGGGQEINTGEAGISEWLMAINNRFQNWQVFISPNLTGVEYDCEKSLKRLEENSDIHLSDNLHLSVSMRSFRAENLSELVKNILEREFTTAQKTFQNLSKNYPLVLTRNLTKAKDWLQQMARGSERYGIVVSSQAQRLKPFAIDVKTPVDPVHWFLNDKLDVRSSFYLEDVVTEFQIQGLELDWSCVVWDGDLRYSQEEWMTFGFKGDKWQKINKPERKLYLLNAYRVLLTRARQGMVIVLPEGSETDHTRKAEYYDATYEYLKEIGIPVL